MLISDSYRQQQETLHSSGSYGTVSAFYAPLVAKLINHTEAAHILDYGCGSNLTLMKTLAEGRMVKHPFKYQAYDPCVPQYATPPVPAELVACIDVLEHIEPDNLDEVLDHLYSVTEAVGFFSVSCVPAKKVLPDGRNAHLIQEQPEFWLPRIMCRWELQTFQVTGENDHGVTSFYVVVKARSRIEDTNGNKM